VPGCGFRAQDIIDDSIYELSNLINNPSAEGLLIAVKTFPNRSPPR